MRSRICPYREHCHDAGNCEECDHGKTYDGLTRRIKRLKARNETLMRENERLKEQLETILHPQF